MKKQMIAVALLVAGVLFAQCGEKAVKSMNPGGQKPTYGGFENQVKWGEHLVTVSACHDCHTPKVMTAHGPDLDSTLLLSGHPAKAPAPDITNRGELERKGLTVTGDLTSWVGPWGISYTANLTSDVTGIGSWTEAQFMRALREGKFKGLEGSRPLLPPMPWVMYKNMTDDEIKAIFAYLKSTKPVRNIVPAPEPPVTAMLSAQ